MRKTTKKPEKSPPRVSGAEIEKNYKKRDRYFAFFLAVFSTIVCTVFIIIFAKSESSASSYDYTVVIDAGHGGIDSGVLGTLTGVKESDLNLAMAFKLKQELENHGFNVVLTRTDKNGLYGIKSTGFKRRDMEKRKEIILNSKANMVISLHMNKFALTSRKGPQVFFDEESKGSKALAGKIQFVLNKFTGNDHEALRGDYFILQCTTAPSVIVECGFLSNSEDESNLIKEDYQKQLVAKIFEGVMLYISGSSEKIIQIN